MRSDLNNCKNCFNVFILTNTLKSGGAEKQSILLAKTLSKKFRISFFVYYGDLYDVRMLSLLDNSDFEIIWLKGNHISKLRFLYKKIRENKKCILISYLATTNIINALVGKLGGSKIRIGGIRSSKFDFLKLYVQKILHNHFLTCSVFNNYSGFNILTKNGFQSNKSVVIHNCIEYPPNLITRVSKNEVTILTVGRFVAAKNYKVAFEAVAKLNKHLDGYSIKYIVIGQGPLEKKLKKYADKIGISSKVVFIINPSDISKYYRESDIYLSTSLYEGLSNSIMEAMSFSLPVIATNVGDNHFLVQNDFNGYIVPVDDVDLILNKLKILINHPEKRQEMGKKSYTIIKDGFSLGKFSSEYLSLIQKLIDES